MARRWVDQWAHKGGGSGTTKVGGDVRLGAAARRGVNANGEDGARGFATRANGTARDMSKPARSCRLTTSKRSPENSRQRSVGHESPVRFDPDSAPNRTPQRNGGSCGGVLTETRR